MQEAQEIYVVVSHTGTVFSEVLKRVTKAPYNHVSLSLDPELGVMYSFARRELTRPWIAGLVREHPLEGMFYLQQETRCRVYRVPITKEQYQSCLQTLQMFMGDYDRYRYNFLGLGLILLGIPMERENHYACSQFVAYVLQQSQIAFESEHYSLIRPDDFCHQPQFELVYEGELQDYQARCFNVSLHQVVNS